MHIAQHSTHTQANSNVHVPHTIVHLIPSKSHQIQIKSVQCVQFQLVQFTFVGCMSTAQPHSIRIVYYSHSLSLFNLPNTTTPFSLVLQLQIPQHIHSARRRWDDDESNKINRECWWKMYVIWKITQIHNTFRQSPRYVYFSWLDFIYFLLINYTAMVSAHKFGRLSRMGNPRGGGWHFVN